MSAIVGVFHTDHQSVCPEVIDAMLAALSHRGPDGTGRWCVGSVALGQQHQQVTPESCNEQLPLHDPAAGLVLVADCRLDNRADLGEALAVPHAQRSAISDSQLILLAYKKWGADCVVHLLGAFAFACWDPHHHALFCGCDHMGLRPLYIYHDHKRFVFATEIKGILAHPAIPIRLNQRKLARLAVPASPLLDKEATYFDPVFQLPAATTVTVTAYHVKRHTYWKPDPTVRLSLKPADAFEAFRELWFKVVAAHLRSAFPVVALLSGGLDSSSIVATAAHVLRQQNRQLMTLSAVLPPDSEAGVRDEKPFIGEFRAWDNIEQVFITDSWRGPLDNLKQLVWSSEVPTHTPCHYLYTAFAEAAVQRQARVLIDGVGGEFGPTFHGDGYYPELFLSGRWRQLVMGLYHEARQSQRAWWRGVRDHLIGPFIPPWLLRLRGGKTVRVDLAFPQAKYQPLQTAFVEQTLGDELVDVAAAVAQLGRPFLDHRHNQQRNIGLASMYAGNGFSGYENISLTLPYFDKRVIEFCLAAPGEVKVWGGYRRYLIRASLTGVLPPAIQWRTSKEPFSPDLHLRYNRQRPQVQARLASIAPHDPIRRIVDVEKLKRLATVEMPAGWTNTPAHEASMNTLRGIYLIAFLRQFGEYAT
jgi:asparagine synthase (glutamine-hydrolysing)